MRRSLIFTGKTFLLIRFSDAASAGQSITECDFVCVFEVAADRQAASQASHRDPERLNEPGQVHGGGVAFEVGIGSENDLRHRLGVETAQELAHLEVFGTDAFDWRQGPVQNMIASRVLAGAIDSHYVKR